MKKIVFGIIMIITIIITIIYFVFSSDRVFNVTYIKFDINPEFIFGIDENNMIKIYNPINEDAQKYTLSMFNNLSLNEGIKKILNSNEEFNNINITVMSKNIDKVNKYITVLNEGFNGKNITFNVIEPTYEELIVYSNEVVYDVESKYNNENILEKIEFINNDLNKYLTDKIKKLVIPNKVNKQEFIISKYNEGYFNNYFNDKEVLIDNYKISNNSSYNISFNEEEYNIEFNIWFEFINENNVIEQYNVVYKNNEIITFNSYFYSI